MSEEGMNELEIVSREIELPILRSKLNKEDRRKAVLLQERIANGDVDIETVVIDVIERESQLRAALARNQELEKALRTGTR